jgi:hypothetical protein
MYPDETVCGRCGRSLAEEAVFKPTYRRDDLLELGLSPMLVDFVFRENKPCFTGLSFEPKDDGGPCYFPEDVTLAYPLWSCDGDLTAVWKRGGKREFVKLYHHDPDHGYLAQTEQAFIAMLLVPVMERLDWHTPEQVAASGRAWADAATQLNFEYVGEFLALCAQAVDDPDGHWKRIIQAIAKIDGRPG